MILVTVDTLRADHLSLYGYDRETSPALDAWADQAFVFEQATSQAGYTLASVASLFSGLAPTTHGCCVPNEGDYLSENAETLAERFQDAGWATAGLSRSRALARIRPGQGFDSFESADGYGGAFYSAEQLTDGAIDWLDENAADGPFFLYLHYMDPHDPYRAPGGWYERFDPGYDSAMTGDEIYELRESGYADMTEADLGRLVALYDGEIAWWDHQFGRLLEHLDALELSERAAVVIVGDHGEQFYEHRRLGHTHLYQENIHVPLIVRAPGLPGGRLDHRVQTIDVAPTLASLVELPPAESWQGRDLTPLLRDGAPPADAWILSEMQRYKRALIRPDGMKYIRERGRDLLFDLDADPEELRDLARSHPEELEAMSAEMDARLEDAEALGVELGVR